MKLLVSYSLVKDGNDSPGANYFLWRFVWLMSQSGGGQTQSQENAVKVLCVMNFYVVNVKDYVENAQLSFLKNFLKHRSFSWLLVDKCLCKGDTLKSIDSGMGIILHGRPQHLFKEIMFKAIFSIVIFLKGQGEPFSHSPTFNTIAGKIFFLYFHFNKRTNLSDSMLNLTWPYWVKFSK